MLILRKSQNRGRTLLNWLTSYHSFSFGNYYDPNHMGFRQLRVINQDIVQPGQGFAKHSHQNMEIITYVIRGTLIHEDNLGNKIILPAGFMQCMSAGTGIFHSEFNYSSHEELEFLQIWIYPYRKNLPPHYEQAFITELNKDLHLLAASTANQTLSLLTINQDIQLWLINLTRPLTIEYPLSPHRHGWLQIIEGTIQVNNSVEITAGDGLAISEESIIKISASPTAKTLLFDLN